MDMNISMAKPWLCSVALLSLVMGMCMRPLAAHAADVTGVAMASARIEAESEDGERRQNSVVSIGRSSDLPSGQRADSVVSVGGSSSNEGAAQNIVSIFGNSSSSGSVSDSVVSVLGNTYVNGTVGDSAVAVLGNVELGPNAEISGDVVSVGGTVRRDPAAVVHGDVQSILGGTAGAFSWTHSWIKHCLLYVRPLAFAPGLGWAWAVALLFLGLYVCLALLFPAAINRCVRTLEERPGPSILAALLTMLLTPVLLVVLCITIIGIAAVPFVAFGLLCAALFGKAVMLTWLGRRCLTVRASGSWGHPAVAVLIGGAIALLLYVVPVLGFLVYKLLGVLGLGVVVYSLILTARAREVIKSAAPPPAPGLAPAAAVTAAAPASEAASPPPPPAVTAVLPRAGFWLRMGALLLDVLLIGLLLGLFRHHSGHFMLLLLAAYGAVMWKLRGSTVGGIICDLRVVRLDGLDIDWTTAIVRALGCFLSLAIVGLGFIWIAFSDDKQAWHDKIAGTVVVRLAKAAPRP
jgi:uncharacterized RDD family membrane protein YckC